MKTFTKFLLAAAALQFAASAGASNYPERGITMIVPVAAGGPADAMGRLIAPFIEKHLGNNARIAVLNRPGASSTIGFNTVATSRPDGYTFGMIFMTPLLPQAYRTEAKISLSHFELLGNIIVDPIVLAVVDDSPIQSLADLVERAKAQPEAVTIGTSGAGSGDDIAIGFLEEQAKIRVTRVHFKGASESRVALTGGHIAVSVLKVSEIASMQRSGIKVRALAQATQTRSAFAPDLPTFKELGYDVVMAAVRGFGAPKNMPDDVRDKLVNAIANAARDPEFVDKVTNVLFQPLNYVSPEEIRKQGVCLAPGCPND